MISKPKMIFAMAFLILIGSGSMKARTCEFYLGGLHSHTSFSDGEGLPDEGFKMAREQGKMDFWAITDHYEQLEIVAKGPDGKRINKWEILKESALRNTVDGQFVALAGREWFDQSQGHINVLNDPSTPPLFVKASETPRMEKDRPQAAARGKGRRRTGSL